jgi:hypothetical protein
MICMIYRFILLQTTNLWGVRSCPVYPIPSPHDNSSILLPVSFWFGEGTFCGVVFCGIWGVTFPTLSTLLIIVAFPILAFACASRILAIAWSYWYRATCWAVIWLGKTTPQKVPSPNQKDTGKRMLELSWGEGPISITVYMSSLWFTNFSVYRIKKNYCHYKNFVNKTGHVDAPPTKGHTLYQTRFQMHCHHNIAEILFKLTLNTINQMHWD